MARDPRTGMTAIPEPECWELLETVSVGRIAVLVGRQPDIFPVNFAVDHGDSSPRIVIRSGAGLKLAGAVLGGPVSFEADMIHEDTASGWSVVIHGRASEVVDVHERLRLEALGLSPWADADKPRFLVVDAADISGRRLDP